MAPALHDGAVSAALQRYESALGSRRMRRRPMPTAFEVTAKVPAMAHPPPFLNDAVLALAPRGSSAATSAPPLAIASTTTLQLPLPFVAPAPSRRIRRTYAADDDSHTDGSDSDVFGPTSRAAAADFSGMRAPGGVPLIPAQSYTYSCLGALDASTAEETVAAVYAFCRDKALREAASTLHRLGIDVVWDARPPGEAASAVIGRPARPTHASRESSGQRRVGGGPMLASVAACENAPRSSDYNRKRLHSASDPRRTSNRGIQEEVGQELIERDEGGVSEQRLAAAAVHESNSTGDDVPGGAGEHHSSDGGDALLTAGRRPGSGGKRSRGEARALVQAVPQLVSTGKSRRRDPDDRTRDPLSPGAATVAASVAAATTTSASNAATTAVAATAIAADAANAIGATAAPQVVDSRTGAFGACAGLGESISDAAGVTAPVAALLLMPQRDAAGPSLAPILLPADNEKLLPRTLPPAHPPAAVAINDCPIVAGTAGDLPVAPYDFSSGIGRAIRGPPEPTSDISAASPHAMAPPIIAACDVEVSDIAPQMSCDDLFVLFAVYGNVLRVILRRCSKPLPTAVPSLGQSATITYSLAAAASLACSHLQGLVIGGVPLCVVLATRVALESAGASSSPVIADVDYSSDPRLRYTGGNRGHGLPRHAVPPTATLHVANLPERPSAVHGGCGSGGKELVTPEAYEAHKVALASQLHTFFGRFGRVLRVQFPPTGSTRQAFVQLDSVQSAVSALIATHSSTPFGGEMWSPGGAATAGPGAPNNGPVRHIAVSFTAATLRPGPV